MHFIGISDIHVFTSPPPLLLLLLLPSSSPPPSPPPLLPLSSFFSNPNTLDALFCLHQNTVGMYYVDDLLP